MVVIKAIGWEIFTLPGLDLESLYANRYINVCFESNCFNKNLPNADVKHCQVLNLHSGSCVRWVHVFLSFSGLVSLGLKNPKVSHI